MTETMREELSKALAMDAGERRAFVEQLATKWDVTPGTVYRRLRDYRSYLRDRKAVRTDHGTPKMTTRDTMHVYVQTVMGLKAFNPNRPDKKIANPNKAMSTSRAIEIAEKMGKIPKGMLTARTVNSWAKRFGLTVKDICRPRPAVKMISAHPNQVHVIDFSVCEQFYLRDSDGKVLSRSYTYKNKPNESRLKIWSFALVDHFSGVLNIKYYLSQGESSDMLIQGLTEAWSKKNDPQFPFHGAPSLLYGDKGSALMSGLVQNFLSALQVKSVTHLPGHPRAKGIVERSFKSLQTMFETELLICPASSIEELNERAYNWLVARNWEIQTGETQSRNAKWMTIKDDQLIELPPMDILRRVAATGEIRTVDRYCTVRYKNDIYGVPAELVGRKVRVWTDIDGGLSVQDMATGELHPTTERKTAAFGEFNAFKKTDADRSRENALAIAGEIKKEITLTPEVLRRDVPNRYAMPKTGTPVEMDSVLIAPKKDDYGSVFEAKLAIADMAGLNLGDLPQWMIAEIEGALSQSLDKDSVSEIARYVSTFIGDMRSAI